MGLLLVSMPPSTMMSLPARPGWWGPQSILGRSLLPPGKSPRTQGSRGRCSCNRWSQILGDHKAGLEGVASPLKSPKVWKPASGRRRRRVRRASLVEGGVGGLEDTRLLVCWVQIGLSLQSWLVGAPSAQEEEVVPTLDRPPLLRPCQELGLPPFLIGHPETIQRNILSSLKQFCKRNF